LTKKLAAAGFDEDEISEAISWLQDLQTITQGARSIRDESQGAFRVYAGFETHRLGTPAISFLSFLEGAGQLAPAQREIVIERALALNDSPLPLNKLKVIVLMVLWSQSAEIDILLLEELLDDDEQRLLQ